MGSWSSLPDNRNFLHEGCVCVWIRNDPIKDSLLIHTCFGVLVLPVLSLMYRAISTLRPGKYMLENYTEFYSVSHWADFPTGYCPISLSHEGQNLPFLGYCLPSSKILDNEPIRPIPYNEQNFDLDKNFITAWKNVTKLVTFRSSVAKCCKMHII